MGCRVARMTCFPTTRILDKAVSVDRRHGFPMVAERQRNMRLMSSDSAHEGTPR